MKLAILSICIFVLFFQSIASSPSAPADQLTCYKCGNDGICKDENINHGQSVTCQSGVLSCMHGYVKDSNGTRIFIKDCERHQTFFQTVGCVRVKNEYEGQAIDDHLCFCDTNDCNKEYCHPEDCSCAYADPDHCPPEPVDPTKALQCYVCGSTHAHGHGRCDNGDVGTLQTCDHGEKSCVYGKVKEGGQDLVIKACDWDSPVDKNGCINVRSDHFYSNQSFDGNFCYCSFENGCNQNFCNPNDCDCVFADPDHCGGHDDTTPTSPKTPTTTKATTTPSNGGSRLLNCISFYCFLIILIQCIYM